jgi:tRNA dimethylallyltransferase
MSNKLLIVIGGPTGIGKTDVAIRLAQHFKTEIISADSRQLYKELIIGVGRPSAEQLKAAPHHMIGVVSIHSDYSVAEYTNDVLALLDKLFLAHDVVILTGGTGLYVKAITEGFDEIPEVDKSITDKWALYGKENGTKALAEALMKADPEYTNKVDLSNGRRLVRALAVCEATGKPYSSFLKKEKSFRDFTSLPVVLDMPRNELYARIDARVLKMMDQGWEIEAKKLYPFRHLKALDTVGYKELFSYFDGEYSLEEAIANIQQSTRRYAKRQLTWWRNQGEWKVFSPHDVDGIIKAIHEALKT